MTSEMSARLAALQVEQVGVKKPNRRVPRPNQSQRRGKKKKEAREQTQTHAQTPEDANCATARSGLKAGAGRCELRYGAERSDGASRRVEATTAESRPKTTHQLLQAQSTSPPLLSGRRLAAPYITGSWGF